jgi:osmoprotectant transport system ATP-binding protein
VNKTIVFVTHDIDEAIKMGDRIAILGKGGVLEQYDTPRQILAQPANDFVAQFVGADRGIKRLSLTTLRQIELLDPDTPHGGTPHRGGQTGQRSGASRRIAASASVKDALSVLLTDGGRALAVVEDSSDGHAEGGRILGLLTLSHLERLIAGEYEAGQEPDVAQVPAAGSGAGA